MNKKFLNNFPFSIERYVLGVIKPVKQSGFKIVIPIWLISGPASELILKVSNSMTNYSNG